MASQEVDKVIEQLKAALDLCDRAGFAFAAVQVDYAIHVALREAGECPAKVTKLWAGPLRTVAGPHLGIRPGHRYCHQEPLFGHTR